MRSRIPSSPAARDVLAKLIPSMGVISANEPPSAIADLIAAFAALRISLVPPKSENWNTNESPKVSVNRAALRRGRGGRVIRLLYNNTAAASVKS